jgi:transcriptional regulator with XRE-family HTH domain
MNMALKIAILESGKTQDEVARLTGIDASLVSKIVRGYRPATDVEREKLSKLLKKRVDHLFPAAGETAWK